MNEVAIIVAVDLDGAIGRGNALPWHLPDDLKHFKALTLGKPVLMGRKTAQAIGRALPGRRNLVLTRGDTAPFPDQEIVNGIDAALASVDGELAVIGGGEIYAQAMAYATVVHLTRVDTHVANADTFFAPLDSMVWEEVNRKAHLADANHAHAFEFIDYRRR
ncbi:MAG: dihydrofolate reductase [Dokdonella sp.]